MFFLKVTYDLVWLTRVILYNLLVLHSTKNMSWIIILKTLYYVFIESLESTQGFRHGGWLDHFFGKHWDRYKSHQSGVTLKALCSNLDRKAPQGRKSLGENHCLQRENYLPQSTANLWTFGILGITCILPDKMKFKHLIRGLDGWASNTTDASNKIRVWYIHIYRYLHSL